MSPDETTPPSPPTPSDDFTDGAKAALAKLSGLSESAGKIAHDFNNILATISGSAALLEMGGGNPAKHIRSIQAASERGARVMRQLLALSPRLDGEQVLTDVGALLNDLTQQTAEMLGAAHTLSTFAMPGVGEIPLDRSQVMTALTCLVENARDAMPAGGTIMVTAQPLGQDEIGISVHDSGGGIPAEVRARIFEPFFTTKPKGTSGGLGLTIALRIVARHGGRILVRTEPPEGSVFTCVFPCRAAAA